MDDEGENVDGGSNGMMLAVTADPDTWLPKVVFAINAVPEDIEEGLLSFQFDGADCYRIGSMFIQMGSAITSMTDDLKEMSVEDRKEVILLESLLVEAPDPQ